MLRNTLLAMKNIVSHSYLPCYACVYAANLVSFITPHTQMFLFKTLSYGNHLN
jgi:hypothetical protein